MEKLTNQRCVPCEGGIPPMTREEAEEYLSQVPSWRIVEDEGILKLNKTFKFKNFRESWQFFDRIAELAESEGHHPDISVHYNRVIVTLFTYAIKGLFLNDFIMAAKIEEILKEL
ncbi:MAG: 4a-hydroxytetrahydrobiopterin dehydratase [Acetomicrobium sp.]|nr:4a-hydroxytetrahydrobiopterin dehydratase [Acetomicrobium sp.]